MLSSNLADLAIRVIDAWQEHAERFLLGITGPPAAGKSTLATNLRDAINTKQGQQVAEIAPMDGFHLLNAVLDQRGIRPRKGAPDTFDAEGYVAQLRQVRRRTDTNVGWPTYDRVIRHEPVPDAISISPDIGIVITEGNYLLLDQQPWSQVRDVLDEIWYLSAEPDVIVDRLRERHIAMGRTAEQAAAKIEGTDLPNARTIEAGRAKADLVLT